MPVAIKWSTCIYPEITLKNRLTHAYTHSLVLFELDDMVCVNIPVQIQTETQVFAYW